MNVSKRKRVVALCSCMVLTFGIFSCGFSIASADKNPSNATFVGLSKTTSADSNVGQLESTNKSDSSEQNETNIYSTGTGINISTAANNVDTKHAAERQAAAEREAAIIARAISNKAAWQNCGSAAPGLEDIDWEIGADAFIAIWSSRIDNYLHNSALAGYGIVFAQAAWDNSIDPRLAVAISNTESSKGAFCFKSHNAWGWGQRSWNNWYDAISEYVASLSDSYGYSLSYNMAQIYCPPNYNNWYYNTLGEMKAI